MRLRDSILLAALGYAFAVYANAAPQAGLDWDKAFNDRSGNRPLHFTAHYQDSRGTHRLEEWREGLGHLRRRTDDRIDLHADVLGVETTHSHPPAEYLWQIVDLEKKIDNRISTRAMLQTGIIYSYWSMAHVLVRPAGHFRVTALPGETPIRVAGIGCNWYVVQPDGQPETRVCWAPAVAVPLRMETLGADGRWAANFSLDTLDSKPVDHAQFAVITTGLQVRNMDELVAED